MVSHWSLSNSKYPQVSMTFLSILGDLYNAVSWWSLLVVWFLNLQVLIPILWRSFQLQLVSLSPSCTIVFFSSLTRSWHLSTFRFILILLCGLPERQSLLLGRFTFLLLTITKSGRLAEIRWSVCCLKHLIIFASHSLGQILDYAYTTCSYGQIFIYCTSPCRSPSWSSRIHSFSANLLYSLIMWLFVLFLPLHNLHLLFCCILSIFFFLLV